MFTGLILLLVNIKLGLLLVNVLNFFKEGKFKNPRTIKKRIDKNLLYNGFYKI